MTTREKDLATYFLERIDRGLAKPDPDGLDDARAAARFLRELLDGTHTAQSHAPRRQRRAADPSEVSLPPTVRAQAPGLGFRVPAPGKESDP